MAVWVPALLRCTMIRGFVAVHNQQIPGRMAILEGRTHGTLIQITQIVEIFCYCSELKATQDGLRKVMN